MGRAFVLVAGVCCLGIVLLQLSSAKPASTLADIPAAQATPTRIPDCFATWPDASATPDVANNGVFRDTVANMRLDHATPWVLHLNRIHLHIGGSSPVYCYPPVVLYVESGTLEVRLYVGSAKRKTGAVLGSPPPEPPFFGTPEDGNPIILGPGDSITLQDAIYSLHNPGWEDVVFVTSALMTGDLPCPPCVKAP